MSTHCSCIVLTSWLFAMQQYNNTIFVSWIFSILSFSFDGILGNCQCDAIARIKPFHLDGQTDYIKEITGQKLKIFSFSQRAYVNDSMNYCVERAIKQIRGNCIAFKPYENVFDNVSALRTLTMSIFTVHLLPYGWLLCLERKKDRLHFDDTIERHSFRCVSHVHRSTKSLATVFSLSTFYWLKKWRLLKNWGDRFTIPKIYFRSTNYIKHLNKPTRKTEYKCICEIIALIRKCAEWICVCNSKRTIANRRALVRSIAGLLVYILNQMKSLVTTK